MRYILIRKHNSRGFTLSETLAAMLILALVIVITGGGVIVVKDAYQKITLRANAQVLMSTVITKVSDEFRYAEDIDGQTFVSGNSGYKMSFTNDNTKGIMTTYYSGDGSKVESTSLLSDKTMTDGLVTSISDYTYSNDFFKATIAVKKAGFSISQNIVVKPLNQ